MAGIKRKDAPSGVAKVGKKPRSENTKSAKPSKPQQLQHFPESDESDVGEEQGKQAFGGSNGIAKGSNTPTNPGDDPSKFKLETSSAEAHAKQRALAKERKAAKPNADIIQRSKQLWERLRRKSHVPREERKELVAELYTIINGRVRDFVFKHDSVRVIQCALKYATLEQRKSIARELQGDLRTLAESRYGKFLVAKMVVESDAEGRDLIVPEFYGHVKRLINHPEASWVVDDIYRQIASPQQKAIMLREWYGTEFALLNRESAATVDATADLPAILAASPEKRRPILGYLHQMINSLIQKKMTGFTMLHDAMLQYFLALVDGGEDQRAFLEEMMGDIDAETEGGGGDLYKNLAFTKSGSRLVCLALAHGTAKDRKVILRVFRDLTETMAFDQYAKMVLIAGLDIPDDTTMTTKTIYRDLLAEKIEDEEEKLNKMETIVMDLNARMPVLYPMSGIPKWLSNREQESGLINELHEIRKTTSKKAPDVRRKGLVDYLSAPLLDLATKRATNLAQSIFGCQFLTEALLELNGSGLEDAKKAVAELASGDPSAKGHIAQNAACGRMLKTLVMGGKFDTEEKEVKLSEQKLGFASSLWPVIKDHAVSWACSGSSFVIVALLESEDVDASVKKEVLSKLKKGKKDLEAAAKGKSDGKAGDKKKADKGPRGNVGAQRILEKL